MAAIPGSSNYFNNYYNFDQIEGVKERLTSLWDAQNFDGVVELIQNAGQERFECMKFCVEKNTDWVLKNSHKLEVSNLDNRFDLALLCARKSPALLAEFVREFRIEDSKDRFVLAHACGEKVFKSVVKHIANFDIRDAKDRFTLARLFSQGAPEQVAKYFEKFNIEDPKDRFVIASLCAGSNAGAVANNFKKFKLPLKDFFPIMMENEDLFFDLYENGDIVEPLCEFFNPDLDQHDLTECLQSLQDYLKGNSELTSLKWIFDYLDEIQDKDQKWVAAKNVVAILLSCKNVLSASQLEVANQRELFQTVLGIKNLSTRSLMLGLVVDLAIVDPGFEKFNKVSEKISSLDLKSFGGMLPVLSLVLAQLDLPEAQLDSLLNQLLSKKEFKDGPKARSMLSFLLFLGRAPTLPLKEKHSILARLVQLAKENSPQKKAVLMENLQAFLIVLEVNEEALLLGPTNSPFLAAQEAVKRKCPQIRTISDFDEKWKRTFGRCREPWAILTYISKHLNDSRVIDSVSEYIIEVLNGTFKKERYSIDRNKHLRDINLLDSHLLDSWQKDSSVYLKDVVRMKNTQQFEPLPWLQINIVPKLQSARYFINYLQSDNEKDKLEIKEQLKTALSIEGCADKKKGFELEVACIELAEAELDQHEKCLKKLQGYYLGPSEISNIINLALYSLNSRKISQSRSMIGLNTDDPYHFLLCGTDVQGSCLRVDGDPGLTKGLCGYLWNGQTRLLAITNDETGRIMGRSILRLLIDENQKPVLFLEKYYGEEGLEEKIKSLAIETAKRLKLDLTHVDLKGRHYPTKLSSRESRAPYDYSDGLSRLIKREEFEISDVAFLYQQGEDSSKGQGKEVL